MSYSPNIVFQDKLLSPFTLLYRTIMSLPGLIIPLYIIYSRPNIGEFANLAIFLFIFFFTLPSIILKYYYFRYTILDNEINIKSGVLSKQDRFISFTRVQNINISQNFLQKIFKIARVEIETAGDAKTEGILEFVSIKDAYIIEDFIRHKSEHQENVHIESNTYNSNEPLLKNEKQILFELSFSRLLTYGMFRFRPWIIFIAVWLYSNFYQISMLGGINQNFIENRIPNFSKMLSSDIAIFLFTITIFVLVSSWLLGIIWSINSSWKFTIFKENNKISLKKGLLNQQTVAIPVKRIQSIEIVTNPFKKFFSFYSLGIQTAGYGEQGKYEASVPIGKLDELLNLSKNFLSFEIPTEFYPISRKAIQRAFFSYLVLSTIIIVGLSYSINWWILTFGVLIPVLYFAAFLRWEYRAYSISNNKIFIKQGFIKQKLVIIPKEKIQTLHINQSIIQRIVSLGSLYIDTAGSSIFNDAVIADIDIKDAEKLLEMIILEFNKK